MSSFSLPEYDPSFHDLSRLHVIIRLPEIISAKFLKLAEERFPSVEGCYDKGGGLLLLIADKTCDAGTFLPKLAETIREFGQDGLEIIETRMAAPKNELPERLSCFSRFITINDDCRESGRKFKLKMTGTTVFGSGSHPSTKLAVMGLEHLFGAGNFPARVLDVGCGSGILTFCCGFFGAEEVLGIDISPEAIAVAEKNRSLNSLDCRIGFAREEITDTPGSFDMVIANVSAAVMSGMLDDFARLVKGGGKLVLSGLQGRQHMEMTDKMKDRGFEISTLYGQDRWRALLLASSDSRP